MNHYTMRYVVNIMPGAITTVNFFLIRILECIDLGDWVNENRHARFKQNKRATSTRAAAH